MLSPWSMHQTCHLRHYIERLITGPYPPGNPFRLFLYYNQGNSDLLRVSLVHGRATKIDACQALILCPLAIQDKLFRGSLNLSLRP